VVRPGAWREFGGELVAILPPLTLISVARIKGALVVNLIALAAIAAAAWGLIALTGNRWQWLAYGLGAYAIFSWVQALRQRDPAAYRLIWGNPIVVMLAVAFGSISFMTYAIAFWAPSYATRVFYSGPEAPARILTGLSANYEIGLILGAGAAIAAAAGVVCGGILADFWRRRDARGRIFVNMLAIVLPIPAVVVMFTTESLTTYYLASPVAQFFSSMWVGAAVATLQDLVLPRMRATAGATYVLGTTMVGLALGPYCAGAVSEAAHSLKAGIFWLYVVPPFTLIALWIGARRIAALEASKVDRARAAGEPV
jgi:MFS family permease